MARPKKPIDEKQVRSLASIQCSYEEMAAVLQCDPSTLTRRFAQVIKEGREVGKMSLKRKQYEMAMNGNVTMLIWLGKQHLGQIDRPPEANERDTKYIVIDKVVGGKVVGETELQKVEPQA